MLSKGEFVMKVIRNILICIFPLLVWGVYLFLSPYPYTSYTLNLFDLILLFLLLPIGYSVYNSFSRTKWEWIIKSLVFITIHAFGCWLNDFVYIDDFFGKHYFGIIYRPVDFFVIHLILIDIFILLISYLVKSAFVKNKRNNEFK